MRLRKWLLVKRDYLYLRLLLWAYDNHSIASWTWRLNREDGRWHLDLHVDLVNGDSCRVISLDNESGAALAHAFLDFMQTVTT